MTKYIAKQPDAEGFVHYTPEENATWEILFERQMKVIQGRACQEYLDGLKALNMRSYRIPQCVEMSEVLQRATGWSVAPVETIIPLDRFFSLLANRQFPAATFIRIREELDYLKEPDIFHEFFGHCPLLTNPAYADFVQWYGEHALHTDKRVQSILGRLFWFTVEFGLLHTLSGLRIYGGGILSSYEETIYALESPIPQRIEFDLLTVLNTAYRYDELQKHYFILNDMSELFQLKTEKIIHLVESFVSGGQNNNFLIC